MSYEDWTDYDIESVFSHANCDDHPLKIKEDILIGSKTLIARNYCPDGWDSESFAIAELANGKFLAIEEWSDSSGHG